jgi:hypothetical protein
MDERKPWLKQPGELYDKHGRPIYPGDLLRSFHFIEARYRRRRYLYHVAVMRDGAMRMEPTAFLHSRKGGGECLMSQELLDSNEAEIIDGHGPGDCLDFYDRPRNPDMIEATRKVG